MAKFGRKFESAKQEWETPQKLFKALDAEFGFTLDVAASKANAKCSRFFTEREDGLSHSWVGDTCWLNPPYKQCGPWIKKAFMESKRGAIVVCLVPARTNNNWWHDYVMKASEVRFIRGRPKFGDAKYGLPQPLALVIFNGAGQTKYGSYTI